MKTFTVSYFYSASGMEGEADRYVVGSFETDTPEQAVDLAIDTYYRGENRRWLRSCLTARELGS